MKTSSSLESLSAAASVVVAAEVAAAMVVVGATLVVVVTAVGVVCTEGTATSTGLADCWAAWEEDEEDVEEGEGLLVEVEATMEAVALEDPDDLTLH